LKGLPSIEKLVNRSVAAGLSSEIGPVRRKL